MTQTDHQQTNQSAISKTALVRFEPIARLSPNRLDELAPLCIIEQVSKDLDPTRMNASTQALYLLKGDLGIRYENGNKLILRAGTDAAKHPLDTERLKIKDTIALTPIDIVRIDLDLLDIMMTWDQLSGYPPAQAKSKPNTTQNNWQLDAASFHAFKVHNGVFNRLPPANIEAMFKRMTAVDVVAGQTIITQGQDGDYYYLIQQGTAEVSRITDISQPPLVLAEISTGAGFGEEALASDTKRNATVTMKTSGQLLRLNKVDFIELLKAPIVNSISKQDAEEKVLNQGAIWIDVRFASEYKHEHIEGSINAPLHELRSFAANLDKTKHYIVYCQTGRRSSAAAFILAQYELQVEVLEGGTRSSP
ncbi:MULTISPECIES: rhodanese-like domain-containing protein [Methylotenera]|uniref:rhodanese-like domain-containing protein n=1 Tax=Methylotenera TaxID=359407 RepID=UPI0003797DF6|nr:MULTISPECIES: rhodanese-like domain-containing protein [Methylotenera]